MTDIVGSPVYSPVKSTPSRDTNSQPATPNQTAPSVVVPASEQNMFTIAKLLDTNTPSTPNLSMGETSTLIAMRDKIDERLRHSEAVARSAPMAFMNQLQLWNILQMMNAGSFAKTEQNEAEKTLAPGFNLQERNLLHPLIGASNNSSNNSDLSRISRESSNASPVESNASDGGHDEDDFGLNPAGGIRKKKTRTVFSRSQVSQLEMAFNTHRYLNSSQRSQLAITLGLTETQVKIWFQNRRNKWKRQANSDELNSSNRSESTGPQPTSGIGSFGNAEAFRLFLQSQSTQFNPTQFIGQAGLSLPQIPQIFGLTTKNDSTNGSNGFEFARLFASNFLNTKPDNTIKKSTTKPETSTSNGE